MKKAVSLCLALFTVMTLLPALRVNAEDDYENKCPFCNIDVTYVSKDETEHFYYCAKCGYGLKHDFSTQIIDNDLPDGQNQIVNYIKGDYTGLSQQEALNEVSQMSSFFHEHASEMEQDYYNRALKAISVLRELIASRWLDMDYAEYDLHEKHWGGGTPTCTKSVECAGCHTQYYAHEYEWVVDKAATCGAAGSKHEECKKCHTKKPAVSIDATGEHTWDWVIDKAATCGAAGSKHQKCKNCDATQALNTEIPATNNHDWEWVIDKAATCGAAGSKHEECKNCHTKKPAVSIDATGEHNWSWIVDKAPTCVDGKQHEECSVCHQKRKEDTRIPAVKEHEWECQFIWDGNETEGYTLVRAKYTCSGCNSVFVNGVYTNGMKKEVTEPTCARGYTTFSFTVKEDKAPDGLERTDSRKAFYTDPVSEHDWDWVTDKAATCEETGIKHQKCKNCDATQTENTVIDALGHNWGEPAFRLKEDGKAEAVFKCQTVESHTKTEEAKLIGDPSLDEPEEDKDGKLTYNATVTVGDKVYQGKIEVPIPRAGETGEDGSGSIVTYTYEGDPVTLKKGSNEPVVLRFSRSEFDDYTLEFFEKLVIDNDTAVAEKNYTKEKGSVIITLNADYVGTITGGQHTITAVFSDGSADAVLTVESDEPDAPATGVEDHAGMYICLTVFSVMSLAAVLVYRKRIAG